MDLFSLITALIVIGILLYVVNQWLPMEAKMKQIINVVVLIAVVLWLLRIFIGGSSVGNIRVGG